MFITTWRKYPICVLGWGIRKWERKGMVVDTGRGRLSVWRRQHAWGPSHLQYSSPWGFLITWPFCFHFWIQFKKQETKINENGDEVRVPGTEKVLYMRAGARWDANMEGYIAPSFYAGLHFD